MSGVLTGGVLRWLPWTLVLLLAAAVMLGHGRELRLQADLAESRTSAAAEMARYERERAAAAQRSQATVEKFRAEEQRRVAVLQEIQREHAEQVGRLQADAGRAGAAAGRLRNELADLSARLHARATEHPATAADSTAGADAAELLGQCAGRLVEVAAAADASHAAGSQCEWAYDALMPSSHDVADVKRP